MSPVDDRDAMERFLAAWRPSPVPGLGERAHAAVSDAPFRRRVAWSEAADAARWVLLGAVPLLVVSTVLVVATLGSRSPERVRSRRLFRLQQTGVFVEGLE